VFDGSSFPLGSDRLLNAQVCTEQQLREFGDAELPKEIVGEHKEQEVQKVVEIDRLFRKTVAKPQIYYKFAREV
jgi:hypothetical protein